MSVVHESLYVDIKIYYYMCISVLSDLKLPRIIKVVNGFQLVFSAVSSV